MFDSVPFKENYDHAISSSFDVINCPDLTYMWAQPLQARAAVLRYINYHNYTGKHIETRKSV